MKATMLLLPDQVVQGSGSIAVGKVVTEQTLIRRIWLSFSQLNDETSH